MVFEANLVLKLSSSQIMAISGSAVVEHPSHYPKIKSLNPAIASRQINSLYACLACLFFFFFFCCRSPSDKL
jgi:hypothetical protein